jgi:hypothetical protein
MLIFTALVAAVMNAAALMPMSDELRYNEYGLKLQSAASAEGKNDPPVVAR